MRILGSAMTWLCHLVTTSLRMCRHSALLGVTTWLSHGLLSQCDNDTRYFAKTMVRIGSGISGVVTSVPFHSPRLLPRMRSEIVPPITGRCEPAQPPFVGTGPHLDLLTQLGAASRRLS
ncbi:hypothetical protein F5888DRAFT_1233664 [Russula emetica]|nr:hypothetical protein F5888DRAFT_1233664 [Russula emetica]